jgi:uncharacterized protein YijF (DUF1287 family)
MRAQNWSRKVVIRRQAQSSQSVDTRSMLQGETISIPSQRVIKVPGSPTPFERGGCADSVIHAARKTLDGFRALCDSSRAVASLGGRFDVNAEESCASCAVIVVRGG